MVQKSMRFLLLLCGAVMLTASLMLAAGREPDDTPATAEDADTSQIASGDQAVSDATRNWPTESRNAAMQMTQKYGEPDVVSNEHLMWMNKGDFHEISVYREGVEHNFPSKHMDVVEHKIYMKVPADKVDELSQFDGSLSVNRTRGTVASFCNSEQANIAALNLAADIVNNRRSVQEARQMLASLTGYLNTSGGLGTTSGGTSGSTTGGMSGTSGGDYVDALKFTTGNQNTARDPGQPLTGSTSGFGTGTTGMGTGGTGTSGMGSDTTRRDTGMGRMGTGTGMGTGRGTMRDTSDTSRMGTGTRRGTTTRDTMTDTLRFDTLNIDTAGADTSGGMNRRGTGTGSSGGSGTGTGTGGR